jgi:hypothetical protein
MAEMAVVVVVVRPQVVDAEAHGEFRMASLVGIFLLVIGGCIK